MRSHRAILHYIFDLIFPSPCFGCKKDLEHGEVLCSSCLAGIPLHQTLFCGKCLNRLPENKRVCHANAPYLLGAAGEYHNEIMRKLILALKFKSVRAAATPIAKLVRNYVAQAHIPLEEGVVIPIPLGSRRERKRGFNQSALIGEYIARCFALQYHPECLTRARDTLPQSELPNKEARSRNVHDCFCVHHPEYFMKKTVLLVDDVTTSGATLSEAATILKRSGAKRVIALVAAKA